MITSVQQASQSREQLAHIQDRIRGLIVDQGILREEMAAAILRGDKVDTLLSQKGSVDRDLQELTATEAALSNDLNEWQQLAGRKLAQEARRELEDVTRQAREAEERLRNALLGTHPLYDRIDTLRARYDRALTRAKAAGALDPECATGVPIGPAPLYPEVLRPVRLPKREPVQHARPLDMMKVRIVPSDDEKGRTA